MKSVDSKELIDATVVAYALARALFDEMDAALKQRIIRKAITYLPPEPDRQDRPPGEWQIWSDALSALKKLAEN
jgi:hypothetical protein